MVRPLKPALSLEEQLSLLKARGMTIEDDDEALNALRSLNYYRISGYSFQFKCSGEEKFEPGTSFSTVLKLYDFDSRLRNTIIRYLEIIEVYARTEIAYWFSREYGSYGHYGKRNFLRCREFKNFQQASISAIWKNRDMPSVKNHQKYNEPVDFYAPIPPKRFYMPLWVLVEILSFSTISKFYSAIAPDVQNRIAKDMKNDMQYLGNQLHCMANLRNICAHYGRIYNQTFRPSIRLSRALYVDYGRFFEEDLPTDKFWGYMLGMKPLFPDEKLFGQMIEDVRVLIEAYEPFIELERLGMPKQWLEYAQRIDRGKIK